MGSKLKVNYFYTRVKILIEIEIKLYFRDKHNNIINKATWHSNGNWFISCSNDTTVKLFDIRKLDKDI